MVKINSPYLMIVDDEVNFSESLKMALEDSFDIRLAASLKEARELLGDGIPEAVLLDVRLPDGDGINFIKELKLLEIMPPVIVITAYATVEDAVKALKEGAANYFTKPLEIDKLKLELKVLIENRSLKIKLTTLSKEINRLAPPFITTGTGAMKEIVDKAPMVATLDIPVMLTGETGTGKEKLAQWIHGLSGVRGEMVAINCSAIPKEIFESELFGYIRGAFSGALTNKEGLVERADGGTLFLDEIGELSENMQVKLLRLLESGVYYKVGDPKERSVRFRLITATNMDLSAPGTNFRRDLYYRINGITFNLPPLRDRRQDIPMLASTFIREANASYGKSIKGLTPSAMKALTDYRWPGNIRELKWGIHKAVAVSLTETINEGDITVRPDVINKDAADKNGETGKDEDTRKDEDAQDGKNANNGENTAYGFDPSKSCREAMGLLETRYIKKALDDSNGNKTEAARLLGMSVRVLHYKIKKYKL